jgi:hypothetical protein
MHTYCIYAMTRKKKVRKIATIGLPIDLTPTKDIKSLIQILGCHSIKPESIVKIIKSSRDIYHYTLYFHDMSTTIQMNHCYTHSFDSSVELDMVSQRDILLRFFHHLSPETLKTTMTYFHCSYKKTMIY